MATLADIRLKVRRLTRMPSTAQITDIQIDEYVNTFILYDFPEHLRLFTFRENLIFYAVPSVGEYATNTINVSDPLYKQKDFNYSPQMWTGISYNTGPLLAEEL